MKRFHVHVAVDSIDAAVPFYSRLFGFQPTVLKPDYAKWMVEDPRISFAISARGAARGVNHLGFQLDSDEELRAMHAQLQEADSAIVEEMGASCCYAKSDKYWITDPAGIAWETYHTLGTIPVFGATASDDTASDSTCCTQEASKVSVNIPVKARAGCCS
jgi:hypothetical protein